MSHLLSRRHLLARSGAVAVGAAAPTKRKTRWQSPIVTSVKAYGATGNGKTDDAAAINRAIGATPYGGTVWFPAGTYSVGSTIRLEQGRRYVGGNAFGSIIQQAPGANLSAVVASAGYVKAAKALDDGVTIEDLMIQGASDRNTRGHCLVLMTWRSFVNNVMIAGAPESGIVLSDVNGAGRLPQGSAIENRIENCSVEFCKQYGIWVMDHNFSGKVTDGYLLNNVVESNLGPYGIRIDRAAGWFIENNHVYDSLQSAYRLNQAWCTYFAFNEVDTFGLAGDAGRYRGFEVNWLLVDGRPSVMLGNISATASQRYPHSQFIHYDIRGNNPGVARVTLIANIAHNDAELYPASDSAPRATNSVAYRFQADPQGELQVTDIANRSDGIGVVRSLPTGQGTVTFVDDYLNLSDITGKGDILAGTGPAQVGRLPLGEDGDVLVVDRSTPTGMRWANPRTLQ